VQASTPRTTAASSQGRADHWGRHARDLAGGPSHAHDHASELKGPAKTRKARLWLAIILGACVMSAEIAGGLAANSLVLLADAAHYATDLAAVALALVAVLWSERLATRSKTFGYQRGEVVAAFTNALALWGISAVFIWEACQRLLDPPAVAGPIVFAMGAVTLAVNLLLAKVLHGGTQGNVNMRAAYLHVLSDALGSGAALAAGALVYYKGWHVADPLLTLFTTVLILVFTWKLTRQTLHILMEGAPEHADLKELEDKLLSVPEVQGIHDLHVWTVGNGQHSMTAHVVLKGNPQGDRVAHEIHDMVSRTYRIDHVTIQVEAPDCLCTSATCAKPA
jgi:cobalt-zinc-cadmium efflux system protein